MDLINMEMMMMSATTTASPAAVILSSTAAALVVAVVVVVVIGAAGSTGGWVKSQRIRRKLVMQGIKGPSPCFLYGNAPEMHRIKLKAAAAAAAIQNKQQVMTAAAADVDHDARINTIVAHDYTSTIFPYLEHWRKQYGLVYTYSSGLIQHLYVNEPELVKEMSLSTSLVLGKPSYLTKKLQPMLGNGIIRANGSLWAHQRKIIAPEFFLDKVKGMVGLMIESAEAMLRKWEEESVGGDIRIDGDLRSLTADVIAKTCFGSSFSKGRHIFSKLRLLQKTVSLSLHQSLLFGVVSAAAGFLPNKKQREITSLEKEIESLIWETVLVKQRQTSSSSKDLLQLILEGATPPPPPTNNSNDSSSSDDNYKHFVVDNCKNIYFAGHEATALTATWCLMLLALHPEWQSLMRTEVAQLCKNGIPDADSIPHLKTVGMVIQEAMRLYPPAAFVSREALEEVRIGNILVPKGTCIWTLIPALHRDPDMWGPDANEFKPDRFRNGVAKACKIPQAYAPFGAGARLCLGKNFAMVQLKVLLSLIVSRFTFTLSPAYNHSPTFRMLVEPEHGVQIRVQTI